ncbi:MAG TPA: ArsC/Spx/MgsR family protein [Vicinamibacteria bacterium]
MKEKDAAFETVDLFKSPPSAAQIRELCRKLGVGPRDILRTREPEYQELGLASGQHSDAELFELMARNPGLIQRPIVVKGDRAVLARPVEALDDLFR